MVSCVSTSVIMVHIRLQSVESRAPASVIMVRVRQQGVVSREAGSVSWFM